VVEGQVAEVLKLKGVVGVGVRWVRGWAMGWSGKEEQVRIRC
jgi:type IV secretory pathway VirB2 component (pilin)